MKNEFVDENLDVRWKKKYLARWKKWSSPGLMMSRVKEETKTEREDIKTERKKPVPMLLEMRKYVSYLYS